MIFTSSISLKGVYLSKWQIRWVVLLFPVILGDEVTLR